VADKFIFRPCAALLVLVELERVQSLIALVIIGREIAISALREWMAQIGARAAWRCTCSARSRPSRRWSRFRSCCFHGQLFGLIDTQLWGTWLIYVSAVLTIWSMVYSPSEVAPRDSRQGQVSSAAVTAGPSRGLIRAMPWVFVLIWSTGFIVARYGMPHFARR